MSNPSPYLEAAQGRWAEREALVGRDVELLLDELQSKTRSLADLRTVIQHHRREDIAQLAEVQTEIRSRWDERLKRLEEWVASCDVLVRASDRSNAWQAISEWLARAQELVRKSVTPLTGRADRIEREFAELNSQIQSWLDRLILRSAELKEIDGIVSLERKRTYQNLVYAEREEEARLGQRLRSIRSSLNLVLRRFERAKKIAGEKADANPGYFEIQKNQVFEPWIPVVDHFQQLREIVLTRAISFEEGRQRLRAMYDTVQRLHAIQDTTRKPFLHRLFHWESD